MFIAYLRLVDIPNYVITFFMIRKYSKTLSNAISVWNLKYTLKSSKFLNNTIFR